MESTKNSADVNTGNRLDYKDLTAD